MTSEEEKAYEDQLDGSDWEVPPIPDSVTIDKLRAENERLQAESVRLNLQIGLHRGIAQRLRMALEKISKDPGWPGELAIEALDAQGNESK